MHGFATWPFVWPLHAWLHAWLCCVLADDLSRCVHAGAAAVADLSAAHTGHSTCTYCLHVDETLWETVLVDCKNNNDDDSLLIV